MHSANGTNVDDRFDELCYFHILCHYGVTQNLCIFWPLLLLSSYLSGLFCSLVDWITEQKSITSFWILQFIEIFLRKVGSLLNILLFHQLSPLFFYQSITFSSMNVIITSTINRHVKITKKLSVATRWNFA